LLVSWRRMCWDGDIVRCVAFRCTACAGLRRAALALAAERGIDTVTSEGIAERAGLTLDGFARHYRDAEECLVAAYDEGPASSSGPSATGSRARAFRDRPER
jgi:AcrR family transcriptional regulator